MKIKKFVFLLLLSLAVFLIPNLTFGESPDYIKDVVAYHEGSYGIVVYFILADSNGRMIAADGTAELIIYNEGKNILDVKIEVKKEYFVEATIGMGPFKHKALSLCFGRLKYSYFKQFPRENSMGKVIVCFTPKNSKKEMCGKDIIIF